jgi:hypothetical protein
VRKEEEENETKWRVREQQKVARRRACKGG